MRSSLRQLDKRAVLSRQLHKMEGRHVDLIPTSTGIHLRCLDRRAAHKFDEEWIAPVHACSGRDQHRAIVLTRLLQHQPSEVFRLMASTTSLSGSAVAPRRASN